MNESRLIFECMDSDGDQIRVVSGSVTYPGCLYLENTSNGDETSTVRLNLTEVRQLHSVLGAWLSQDGITAERTPEPATHVDERVTAEDVRRIVVDELTKREALWGDYAHEAARQEVRNFLTRAIEMGADQ